MMKAAPACLTLPDFDTAENLRRKQQRIKTQIRSEQENLTFTFEALPHAVLSDIALQTGLYSKQGKCFLAVMLANDAGLLADKEDDTFKRHNALQDMFDKALAVFDRQSDEDVFAKTLHRYCAYRDKEFLDFVQSEMVRRFSTDVSAALAGGKLAPVPDNQAEWDDWVVENELYIKHLCEKYDVLSFMLQKDGQRKKYRLRVSV